MRPELPRPLPPRSAALLSTVLVLLVACGGGRDEPEAERDTSTLTGPPDPVRVEVDGNLHFGEEGLAHGDFTSMVVRAMGPPKTDCDLGEEKCAVGSVLVQTPHGPIRYDVLRLDVYGTPTRAEAIVHVVEERGEPGPDWFYFVRVGGPCGNADPDCSMTLTVEDSYGHEQVARFGSLHVARTGG